MAGGGGVVGSGPHRHDGVRVTREDGRLGVELHLALAWGASEVATLVTGSEAPQYVESLALQMRIADPIAQALAAHARADHDRPPDTRDRTPHPHDQTAGPRDHPARLRTHDARLYLGRRGDSAYAHRRLHFGSEASAFRSTHGGTQLDDHSAGRGGSCWGMDGGAHRR